MDYGFRKDMILEHIVPSSWQSQSNDFHYLNVRLPGFRKDEVRIRADGYGRIVVSGEREVNNKIIHFDQSFKIADDWDIEEASGDFEGNVFRVAIPKKVVFKPSKDNGDYPTFDYNDHKRLILSEEEEGDVLKKISGRHQPYHNGKYQKGDQDDERLPEEEESSVLKKISKQVMKIRVGILTAAIAFALGVLVSHRYKKKEKGKDESVE